ncbi:hypothetical protein GPUN_1543 [Glaciecola punicea ACAM 611]|uniref:Uncharacterized protein n=1 Tax=Glaciecola punicea ACAM 611 TaxID=1121923 RepID=H5TBI6_9ALTE|nr:hypothetical protein GPUN_1543 [Glaciecola punicea ACAM 611]
MAVRNKQSATFFGAKRFLQSLALSSSLLAASLLYSVNQSYASKHFV